MEIPLRILAVDRNKLGDLFTRLTKDLFFALGYDDLQLNVHKTGREIDVQGKHRFEPRNVVAECKAHSARMGGEELNKFFGVLTRERFKCAPVPVAGYFVSLSGFTETGIEQEKETGDNRVILLGGEAVVRELERSRVIVPLASATERAGECLQHCGVEDAERESAELLGHDRGYIWAMRYSRNKAPTHLALVHADGTPLAESVAREVIDADRKCSGLLHSLTYLAPAPPPPERAAVAAEAAARYRRWLGEECGFVQLDGLPADTDVSATRLKLERLFVPLKAYFLPEAKQEEAKEQPKVIPIGLMLGESAHLAVLATPGGGKSMLLKRLATAYAFPGRRIEVSDALPEREWLPLFLRCRELKDRACRPIHEILDDLPRFAGMNDPEAAAFREFLHARLRAGQVLLLVDGLDEISEEGARQTFANHLRTFLAIFPKAAIVVSSREAGFRLVAGVVASACRRAKLAPFDENDVQQLCERWNIQVVGDSEKVRTDARELARTIWENERIRTLAENPLLLTTLLVVKRWVGELPRNRVALYREAVRVLIRTWNVEGYAPLDEDETLTQLSYVACAMMEGGIQRIGAKALAKLLDQARHELEPELRFVAISTPAFIERIEYRSSLLMQTGHDTFDGELQPVYEFRHLTFQEYLAARGYVEELYPGRAAAKPLLDLIEPHFEDERWQEVIALAAVLAGRKAEHVIRRLSDVCAGLDQLPSQARRPREAGPVPLLKQCLLDEVQVTTQTLRSALRQAARHYFEPEPTLIKLRRGKYGALLHEATEEAFFSEGASWEEYLSPMAELAVEGQFGIHAERGMTESLAHSLLNAMEAGDRREAVKAALTTMYLAYLARSPGAAWADPAGPDERFRPLQAALCGMLRPDDPLMALAGAWALAWIGQTRVCPNPIPKKAMLCLFQLWSDTPTPEQSRFFAWALGAQPLWPRDSLGKAVWGECDDFLRRCTPRREAQSESRVAALVVAWYRRGPWTDEDLVREFGSLLDEHTPTPTIRDLFQGLGDAGKDALRMWGEKQDQRRQRPQEG
jgi:hypothetical protein